MRILDNVIFGIIMLVVIAFWIYSNGKIFKSMKLGDKRLVVAQFVILNVFFLLTIYKVVAKSVDGDVSQIAVDNVINQIVIAIMLISTLVYSIYSTRTLGKQLVGYEIESEAMALISVGFVLVVVLAVAFRIPWGLKWIL